MDGESRLSGIQCIYAVRSLAGETTGQPPFTPRFDVSSKIYIITACIVTFSAASERRTVREDERRNVREDERNVGEERATGEE